MEAWNGFIDSMISILISLYYVFYEFEFVFLSLFVLWSFHRKRTCYINAGMTHNCDFKDLLSAMNARRFWESQHSPGRKKRNTINPNPTISNPNLILFSTQSIPLNIRSESNGS